MAISTLVAATALLGAAPPSPTLRAQMDQVCRSFQGRMGYYVKNLKTGESWGYRAVERFPSASTIKTVLMIEALKQIEEGRLSWTEKIKVPPKDKRSSSIWVAHLPEGYSLNVEGLVNLMMNVSDNTATVMLSERLNVESIERRLLDLGFKDTACTIRVPASNKRLTRLRQTFLNMGVTSPLEMGRILESIYRGKAASASACERMVRMMGHQYWDDFFSSQIPPDVMVCSKVGALERSRSDIAIVYGPTPYILTAYTDNAKDRTWRESTEGHVALRALSRLAWNGLNPTRPYRAPSDAPRWYPTGAGVEGL